MFDISMQALAAQLLVGLINGCFYAMLSMGLAIIFGLLNIINFAHGAQFMVAAFLAWIGFTQLPLLLGPTFQINFWAALVLAPVIVGGLGVLLEKTLLKRLYHLDHLYGLLLTFGVALVLEGAFRHFYGISGVSYDPPPLLQGGVDLGLHVPAGLPRLRGRRFHPDLPGDLVPLREDQARCAAARRHREPQAAAGLRREHPADDHAHLRLRRRAGRAGRRDGHAHHAGQSADGRQPAQHRLRGGGDRRARLHRWAPWSVGSPWAFSKA
jgi:hypothetical protein